MHFRIRESVLVRIKVFGAGHHDGEWPQSVEDFDRRALGGENFLKRAVHLRRLVHVAAAENYTAAATWTRRRRCTARLRKFSPPKALRSKSSTDCGHSPS